MGSSAAQLLKAEQEMGETLGQIQSGWDAYDRPYVPGINCMECGRFVGRSGSIEVDHCEMSDTIASVSGTCAACVEKGCGDVRGDE